MKQKNNIFPIPIAHIKEILTPIFTTDRKEHDVHEYYGHLVETTGQIDTNGREISNPLGSDLLEDPSITENFILN